MIVRILVQNAVNGEKHVTLTQDQVTPREELLLTSPGWEDSEVVEGRALILGMGDESDTVLADLLEVELHSAWTQHKVFEPNITGPWITDTTGGRKG